MKARAILGLATPLLVVVSGISCGQGLTGSDSLGAARAGSGAGEPSEGAGGGTGMTRGGGSSSPPPAWAAPAVSLLSSNSACDPALPRAGPSPLRRLSRIEYNNMVRDLLGDTTHPADGFVSEEKVVGFNSNSYAPVTPVMGRQYLEAAEKLAETAVTDLPRLLGCGSDPSAACVESFIRDFTQRAFRSPVGSEQLAWLLRLFQETEGAFDTAAGVQAVLTSVLTSPRFLFVLEFGVGARGGEMTPLSSYELAARLALYLFRSVPDSQLIQAAEAGELSTPEQIEAQALRMLDDPKSVSALEDFVNQWLGLENMDAVTKDTQFQASWSPGIAKALHTETLLTFAKTVSENGTLVELLTSPTSYINGYLASYYGVRLGSELFVKLNVNPDPAHPVRSGILTHGSFLAAHAHTSLPSPVLRGKVLRQSLLCRPVAPPSTAGLVDIPPAPNRPVTGKTTRDQLSALSTQAACAGCHLGMDALGFAFNAYDATGQLLPRAAAGAFLENDAVVDSTGVFDEPNTDLDGLHFVDAIDLSQKLARSSQVRQCFAVQQFRYALGRVEAEADACSLKQAYAVFSGAGFSIRRLMVAVAASDAFRTRAAWPAEEGCP